MTKIITISLLTATILFSSNYEEYKNITRTENTVKVKQILNELKNDGSKESVEIFILSSRYSDSEVKKMIKDYMSKDTSFKTKELLTVIEKNFEGRDKSKFLKLLEETNEKVFQDIFLLNKKQLSEYIQKMEVKKEEKTQVKEEKKEEKKVEISQIKTGNSAYQLQAQKTLDLNNLEISMLTSKDKSKIQEALTEISNGKNIEDNINKIKPFANFIGNILLEGLKDKNENIRDSSLSILVSTNNLKDVMENLFDELSFNDEPLIAISNLKDVKKYEDIILKSFKKATEENQEKIFPLLSQMKLDSIIKVKKEIEDKKQYTIAQEERKKSEESKKLELLEKERIARINELNKLKEKEAKASTSKTKDEDIKKQIVAEEKKIKEIKQTAKTKTVEEIVLESLKNKDTQYKAVIEAGNLRMAEAIPELDKIISSSKDLKLKKQVLFTLTKIGNDKSITIIKRFLDSEERSLKFIAEKSLKSLLTKK